MRILRAKTPAAGQTYTSTGSPKTPRNVKASAIAKSKHDPSVLLGRVRRRARIKVVAVAPDKPGLRTTFSPGNDAVYSHPNLRPEFDRFTNNPNPKFDPSKAPGGVTVKRVALRGPQGADSGHQKVIKPNRLTLFGGKRLRRR
jgi:hypothetical protein